VKWRHRRCHPGQLTYSRQLVELSPPVPLNPPRSKSRSAPARGLRDAYNILIILVMLELIEYSGRPYPKGIPVMTSNRGLWPVAYDGAGSPLVLRIDKQSRWFLDGKLVAPDEFSRTLKDALLRRPDRVVYVDGNGDLQLSDVMPAIDSIQGLHATVVLVTPRER